MKKYLILFSFLFMFNVYPADGDLTTRTEATTLNSTDIVYVMQNPGTSKDDRKITIANFTTDDDWDDSHNHTTTTLSGIDISADTNLAVSSPITLTDDTIGINDADDDGSTKGAASFDNTDFNATSGNVTIVDDGHAHTTTSLSGIVLADDVDTFSSANLAGRLTDETGDGGGFARANNATLVAPSLGVATGTSLDISGALEVGSSNNVWSTGTGLIVTSLLKTGDRGDVSINSDTSWSVEDDSHPHTGSTLSSIDISDDTNLADGRSLTLTGDTMAADAELFTNMYNFSLEDPVAADDDLVQIKFATAITITRLSCSTDTGNCTINFDERNEAGVNATGTIIMSAGLVCLDSTVSTTSFTNATIAADSVMNLFIEGSGAGVVRVHIDATKDD